MVRTSTLTSEDEVDVAVEVAEGAEVERAAGRRWTR